MNLEFIVITVGYSVSAIITIGLGIFVLRSNAEKTVRVTFFLWSLAVFIYELMFVLGTNVTDPALLKKIWLFNLVDIYIVAFMNHWVFAILGRTKEKRKEIFSFYVIGTILTLFFLLFPETFFVGGAAPKMYFPNYLVPGKFYWVMLVFFFAGVAYFYYHLIRAYFESRDPKMKNRLLFFIWGLAIGYGCGSTAWFLVWDIQIDPILSMFTGFYTIPLAYGIVKYQLMDIKVVIKKAFFYSLGIASAGGIITAISLLNDWFVSRIAGFRFWFIPLFAGTIAIVIGKLFWNKSKEVDKLKYEFITIAAHKLRTPLTRIKWIAVALLETNQTEKDKQLIGEIKKANNRLVELVDILLETSKTEKENYLYELAPANLEAIVKSVISDLKPDSDKKQLIVNLQINGYVSAIEADTKRLKTVVQVLLENAITYTLKGGTIDISIIETNSKLTFSIKDSGIGISKEDLPYIFEKFHRSHRASVTDTEGSGLGLFIAKNIIKKHGGAIGVESKGEDQGSRFWFTMPIFK